MIAAEAAVLLALGFTSAAMAISSNPFSAGGSPALLGAAVAALVIAIGCLGMATANLGPCTIGPCAASASTLFALLLGLLASLTVLAGATAGTIVPSSIPFAGAVLVSALGASMVATGAMFPEAARAAASLEVCTRGLATATPGGEVAIVLGVVVLAVAILSAGAVGNRSPFGSTRD